MMRWSIILAAVAVGAAGSGCDSATEPADLDGPYYATSVNGGDLPARRIEWFSNSAGTCERDLDAADMFFRDGSEFDLYVHYTVRCVGMLPSRPTVHLEGFYSINGSSLELDPISTTSDAIVEARLSGRNVIVVIRRQNANYDLRFAPGG